MSNEIVTLSIIILRRKMKIVGRAQISSIRKKKKKNKNGRMVRLRRKNQYEIVFIPWPYK